MSLLRPTAFLLPILLAAPALRAQDDDRLKRDLLREVEKRLKAEEEKLLREIEKVIDEELGKRSGAPAAPRKPRGFLGVRSGDLTEDERKDLGIPGGIRVIEVVPDGPAAKAGLKADDVITAVDGKPVESPQEIPGRVQGLGPGSPVRLDVLREGKKLSLTVALGVHPADAEDAPAPAPKEKGKAEDELRERLKRSTEKGEAPKEPPAKKPGAPKPKAPPAEGDDLFAFDEDTFEQFRGLFEQFGVDPEEFFKRGEDGKYRFGGEFKDLFKNFNLERFKDLLPKMEPPAEPAPRRPAPGPAPWLGFQPEELSEDLRTQLDLPAGRGLLVAEVLPGSPAEKAGLRKSDILLKIDGRDVTGEDSLAAFMKGAKVGQEVVLGVLRKGKETSVKAVVGERKP
jgi:membrane-associated protease RseP (regulator of RpoE activity)